MPQPTLDHRQLYRMPWSLTDNVIAWLEPTSHCNLACEGCYRTNVKTHKSLDEVNADLDVFAQHRTFDSVSIAGGDPLMHPRIVDIVRLVAKCGWKPTINTNGLALTEELLRDLKRAGLKAVTFHIDSKQGRPGWKTSTEQETNQLRLRYAEMVAREGNILCAFNSTVYEKTLDDVPDLVSWAQEHIDIVHAMIFICYREAILDGTFAYFASGKQIDAGELVYTAPEAKQRIDISARDVVDKIREKHPDFMPCSYLNGTHTPDSFKWLIASRVGTQKQIYSYWGPRMMELTQTIHHAWTGRYLAYADAKLMKRARSLLALAPFDGGMRQAARHVLRRPWSLKDRMYLQSIAIIQPIDLLDDGRQNMCDGCPDMTIYDGKLAWSCRLDECLRFGEFVRTIPHNKDTEQPTESTSQSTSSKPPSCPVMPQ